MENKFTVVSSKLAGYEGADTYNVKITRELSTNDAFAIKKKETFYLKGVGVDLEVGSEVPVDLDNYNKVPKQVDYAGEDMTLIYLEPKG